MGELFDERQSHIVSNLSEMQSNVPGGRTRVLPMAIARVRTTSIAILMLLNPPPSGSKVRYRSTPSVGENGDL